MSENNAYEKVKGGRLTFKGGSLAARAKGINKKKKKNKRNNNNEEATEGGQQINPEGEPSTAGAEGGDSIYTIDAAKKMKYEELFPVETKKFGYDPKAKQKSVEDALDDRVKKKADRYCK